MLTVKTDKKKIFQYSAVLGVIFLIILYLIISNFVIKPGSSASGSGSRKSVTSGVIKEVNDLDAEVINSEKFNSLKENSFKEVKVEDLNVGKKDLFTSPRSSVRATSSDNVIK